MTPPSPAGTPPVRVGLGTVAREWGRIGCLGFGGPPAHIALLRRLCVQDRRWLSAQEFEDAIAACNLLPGPASTQLAIFCSWRVAGRAGALVGGAAFILPGLVAVLALATLFLTGTPPVWVRAAAAGGGAAVAAVAVQAGAGLVPASRRRSDRSDRSDRRRQWALYLLVGALAAALLGPWLVVLLLGCGVAELLVRRPPPAVRGNARPGGPPGPVGTGLRAVPVFAAAAGGGGVLVPVAWVALKVGALSYGGGFVIIPLMQADAVGDHHWMTATQFLGAVAIGQITPGPVVQTVAVVGYAAAGYGGGVLASLVAFGPSFAFILLGAAGFDRLRGDRRVRAFLDGAGPAAVGAILGSAVPLALALERPWQYAVLGGAAVLLALRRGVVLTLLAAAVGGVVIVAAGGSLPH